MNDGAKLELLAQEYVTAKAELDKLKKKVDTTNAEIKALMKSLNMDEVELSDGRKVVYSVTIRESLDEDKLIASLKEYAPYTDCIKKKEYIDTDIMEKEIYSGNFSSDAMLALDGCRIVQEIPKLEIKKAKKVKS